MVRGAICLTLILALTPPVFARTDSGDTREVSAQTESYSDALKKVVLGRPKRGAPGVPLPEAKWGLRRHIKLAPDTDFRPNNGLEDRDAVPYLIDVMRNGPAWKDDTRLTAYGGVARQIARCSAALNLGAHKDPRAFEPLLETLEHGELLAGVSWGNHPSDYDIRRHAAMALGMLGDVRAVDPLVSVLKNRENDRDLRLACMWPLARFRDMRTLPVMIEAADELDVPYYHTYFSYMTGIWFEPEYGRENRAWVKEFPELGQIKSPVKGWRHWLKVGEHLATEQFDEHYAKWKEVKQTDPEIEHAIRFHYQKMLKYGVATLPRLIERIEKGETDLISAVREITSGKVKEDATRREVLDWWDKNKERWLIPFGKSASEDSTRQ